MTDGGRFAKLEVSRGSWAISYPFEAVGATSLRFQGQAACFRNELYAITTDGRLAHYWTESGGKIDFPAELAGGGGVRFLPGLAVLGTDLGKSVFAITTDGRLAQVWDSKRWQWHIDFPAELAGSSSITFQGTPGALHTRFGKSVFAVTADGRFAQVWEDGAWHVDFPAELAGHTGTRFNGQVNAASHSLGPWTVVAVTDDGQLAKVWNDGAWHLDYPAALSGHGGLRFQGRVDVDGHGTRGEVEIFALVTDGRIAHFFDEGTWKSDFPAEIAGRPDLRFTGGVFATVGTIPGSRQSAFAITADGVVAQLWDSDGWRWNVSFPSDIAQP
jgi:hypothetical protein